jgi:hypothetical protein
MEELEMKALLATQPMRRTEKGARVVLSMASDLSARQLALLRRFTGETLLEYLAGPNEPMADLYADAIALHSRGLIAPASEFQQLPGGRVHEHPRDR